MVMTERTAIVVIVVGLIAIVSGTMAKTFYVASAGMASNRQMARWKGRLIFIGGGVILLLLGIQYFIFQR